MRDILKEEHLEAIRKNAEKEKFKECTFKPKINKYLGLVTKEKNGYSKPTLASQNKTLGATSLSPILEKPKMQTQNLSVYSIPHNIENRLQRRASSILDRTLSLNFDQSIRHSNTIKTPRRFNLDSGNDKLNQSITVSAKEVIEQPKLVKRYLTTCEVTISEIVSPNIQESFIQDAKELQTQPVEAPYYN